MSEDRSHEHDTSEPAPGAEHGETKVDKDADTSHGTGAAPEHVDSDAIDEDGD